MSMQENNLMQTTGKVVHQKIEGGFWGIEGDDGKKYRPQNLSEQFQKDGLRVSVEMQPVMSFGIAMWGIEVKLLSIKAI